MFTFLYKVDEQTQKSFLTKGAKTKDDTKCNYEGSRGRWFFFYRNAFNTLVNEWDESDFVVLFRGHGNTWISVLFKYRG